MNGDIQAFETHMTEELCNYFKGGPTFSYDNHFDKNLVHWDIKTIVEDWLGANSWDDISEVTKKSSTRTIPGVHYLIVLGLFARGTRSKSNLVLLL